MAGPAPMRLGIEIVAEVARIQADMDRVRRLVKSASGDIASSARAANDNLSRIGTGAGKGIEQFSREVARMKASIDPAWGALQRYREQVHLLQQALREGAISHKTYVDQMRQAVGTYQQAGKGVAQASNAQRAGMQQLSFQIGDVAQQFALGTPPMRIFAQQGGQVVQAVSLMRSSTGGLIGFLGGPWGAVLMGAATVLGMLISSSGKASQATNDLTSATDVQRMSIADLIVAINERVAAESKAIQSSYESEAANYAAAQSARTRMIEEMKLTKVRLEGAQAALRAQKGGDIGATGADAGLAALTGAYEAEIRNLNTAINEADELIRVRHVPLIKREVTAAYDEAAAATLRFDKAEAGLTARFREGGLAAEAYQTELLRINQIREADLAAIAAQEKAEGQAASAARSAEKRAEAAARAAARSSQRREERLGREAQAIDETVRSLHALADAYLAGDAAALAAEARAKAVGSAIKKQGDVSGAVAAELRKMVAERGVDTAKLIANLRAQTEAQKSVNDAVEAGLIPLGQAGDMMQDELALRPLLAALAIAQAEGYGEISDELERLIPLLQEAQKNNRQAAARAQDQQMLDQMKDQEQLIRQEIALNERLGEARLGALRGLSGGALEDEMARLAAEHEKATIQLRAEAEANDLRNQGLQQSAEYILRVAAAEAELVDLDHWFGRQEATIQRVNDQLSEMAGLLSQIGGFGGVLGDFLNGLQTGNFAGLGPAGGLLNILLTPRDDMAEQVSVLSKRLTDIFGIGGDFASTLASALQGAGIGAMAGSAVFGQQTQVSQLGSMLGGVIGQEVGKSLTKGLTGLLGSIGGPLGSIFGGILGGFVGNILGGGNRGARATMTGVGSVSMSGSDRANYGTAGDLAEAVSSGLQDIAEALGATLGAFNVAIGTRAGEYRVNTSGGSMRLSRGALNFGDDAEAAVAAAIADAIRDGALQGLSAGAQALLQAGGDLQEQIGKALTFEAVFDELERLQDPVGHAMSQLDKEFEALRKIFEEAGASADEYAKLEQLYGIKRAELMEQVAQDNEVANRRREMEIELLQAQGDIMGALAAARQMELEQLDPTLRALQEQIWAAQDAAEAERVLAAERERQAEITRQGRGLEIQLQEALGNAAEASAMRRADELAAMDASLRGLQEQVWAAQDAAEAERVLAAEREAQAALARRYRDLEIQLMRATGDEAGAVAASRELELAALDESLRAIQQEVWAAEDAAEASRLLAEAREEEAARAVQLARNRADLEIRFMRTIGDEAGVLAAQRRIEMEQTDESLRGLLQAIYQAEDQAREAEERAQAQREAQELAEQQARAAAQAAEERARAIREAAQERARIEEQIAQDRARRAETRARLEIELMKLLGNESGAVAKQRQLELAALDESLHLLQKQVWTAQDAAEAQRKLAEVMEQAAELASRRTALEIELMRATGNTAGALAAERALELAALDATLRPLQRQIWAAQDAAKATEELAAAQAESAQASRELANQRRSLEIQLMRALGDEIGAVAAERQLELAALDPALHALQRQVWAAEEAAAAAEKHSSALQQTIDTFGAFGSALREFRDELMAGEMASANAYRAAQVKFMTTSALAAAGDQTALGSLRDAGSAFLSVSRDRAGSMLQYQRDVATVLRSVTQAIGVTDDAVDYAELQLRAMEQSGETLGLINQSVLGVEQAIERMAVAPQQQAELRSDGEVRDELQQLREEARAAQIAMTSALNKIAKILDRADGGDFIRVGNDSDTPLTVAP